MYNLSLMILYDRYNIYMFVPRLVGTRINSLLSCFHTCFENWGSNRQQAGIYYKVRPPQGGVGWFISPMNTIVMSDILHTMDLTKLYACQFSYRLAIIHGHMTLSVLLRWTRSGIFARITNSCGGNGNATLLKSGYLISGCVVV